MNCVAQEVVFAGHKSTMFFCGGSPQPCATCAAPEAPWLCDWPVVRRIDICAAEMNVGDVWITQQAGKRAVVVEIEEIGRFRKFWVLIPGHPDPYPYSRHETHTVTTLREGNCDAPCCEAHVREVGDEVHYCKAHWDDWEP